MSSYKINPSSIIMEGLYWGSFLLETSPPPPAIALLSPGCPPVLWPEDKAEPEGAIPPPIAGCDSHQQSSPAQLLNPEVKARNQNSCQRMIPEGLKKALLAQNPPAPMGEAK